MNGDKVYSGTNMKAEELKGQGALSFTIKGVQLKKHDDGEKLVVAFRESQKCLVLNKGNYNRVKELFGPETDDWAGKAITLVVRRVEFKGEMVDGIRVVLPGEDGYQAPVNSGKQPLPPGGTPGLREEHATACVEAFNIQKRGEPGKEKELYMATLSSGHVVWTWDKKLAETLKSSKGMGVVQRFSMKRYHNKATGKDSLELLRIEEPPEEARQPAGVSADDEGPQEADIPF